MELYKTTSICVNLRNFQLFGDFFWCKEKRNCRFVSNFLKMPLFKQSEMVVNKAWDWGAGGRELGFNGSRISFWEDDVLEIYDGDDCTQTCTLKSVHLKMVKIAHFMLHVFYHNINSLFPISTHVISVRSFPFLLYLKISIFLSTCGVTKFDASEDTSWL